MEGKKIVEPTEVSNEENNLVFMMIKVGNLLSVISTYLKASHPDQNPLNYACIRELQQQDKQLLALQVNNSDT